jgi:hypothetical protein
MKLLIAFLFTGIMGYAQSVYGGFISYPVLMQQYQGGTLPNYYWVGVTNPSNVIPNPNPTDVVVVVTCPSESQTVLLPYNEKMGFNMPKVVVFQKREQGCFMVVRVYAPSQPTIVKGSE